MDEKWCLFLVCYLTWEGRVCEVILSGKNGEAVSWRGAISMPVMRWDILVENSILLHVKESGDGVEETGLQGGKAGAVPKSFMRV